MTKGKKYDYRLEQYDTFWKAEITRRATAKKTVISKSQDGFATESDARTWAERELKSLLENLHERNKRRSENQK